MKAPLITLGVLTAFALSACGGTSSGSVDEAAPSLDGYEVSSSKGTNKGLTPGNAEPLTADQANQRAYDRCLELETRGLISVPMRSESDPLFVVTKMPGILKLVFCVGERLGGTNCVASEFNQVAFQRANINGEAEVLRCSVGDGRLSWLRIEAFPGSG